MKKDSNEHLTLDQWRLTCIIRSLICTSIERNDEYWVLYKETIVIVGNNWEERIALEWVKSNNFCLKWVLIDKNCERKERRSFFYLKKGAVIMAYI